ncbi:MULTISPECIES: caspase family protein [Cryobacterium]|uniref:Caspase family protein n=1 Tax=Cryobacterium breve TaxID=1259258 RepID=A0ABY2J882_9MICO|nr:MULTISPECIES: caspase family protein [Cryobacterium]TFC91266.1 caspase family protein [Cryobacterium sp. TmT3-12]TFD01040.1 caspase family protein [Cryobacterium breve]
MKRALLVGIDFYENFNSLAGCANDAVALHPLLARNEDDSPNLDCKVLTAKNQTSLVTRDALLSLLDELLAPGSDFALFYFAGHGAPVNGDVALVTSDGTPMTPGVAFSEVLERIGHSAVKEVIVILDCCFSGGATTIGALGNKLANLPQGLSVLTASRDDQVSMETEDGRGQFSTYLEGALDGGAADVIGHVNMSGLYAYLSESFGAWEQRPTFKANIDRLHDIRLCDPRVPLATLRMLTNWFPTPGYDLALDPSFEPTEEPSDAENERIFSGLQKYRACRLIEPIDEEHLYYAAMRSTGCRLTPLGKHYWHLVNAGRV